VRRGGAWDMGARWLRASARNSGGPETTIDGNGVRCVAGG
jgi:formylglycine-generating enzyme required for sulfatase activity